MGCRGRLGLAVGFSRRRRLSARASPDNPRGFEVDAAMPITAQAIDDQQTPLGDFLRDELRGAHEFYDLAGFQDFVSPNSRFPVRKRAPEES